MCGYERGRERSNKNIKKEGSGEGGWKEGNSTKKVLKVGPRRESLMHNFTLIPLATRIKRQHVIARKPEK